MRQQNFQQKYKDFARSICKFCGGNFLFHQNLIFWVEFWVFHEKICKFRGSMVFFSKKNQFLIKKVAVRMKNQ